ncbi:MAG: hypothetical protein KAT48_07355 [Bacteroidales bacterium]|nr:hypothetical protein [Bacteroidales bacterium]
MKKLIYLFLLMVAMLTINNVVFAQVPENYIIKAGYGGGPRPSIIYEEPEHSYIGINTIQPVWELHVNGSIALKKNLIFDQQGLIMVGKGDGQVGRLDFDLEDITGDYMPVMSLVADKYVGIGVLNPNHSLHVVGDILVELPGPSSDPILFSNQNGSVGIGNTNPQSKLDVSGNISLEEQLEFTRSGSTIRWTTGDLNFYIGSHHIMVMNEGENIGIGCTNPKQKLQVCGNILTDGFLMPTNAADGRLLVCDALGNSSWIDQDLIDDGDWLTNGNDLYNNNTGNIGIGTSNPLKKLHVTGNTYITGNLGIGVQEPGATLDIEGTLRVSSLTELSGDYKLVFANSDGELFNDNIPLYDNMGNHFMEQDLITGNNWIKNDGESTEGIFIDQDGNVGIGTDQPDGKMDISFTNDKKIQFKSSESNTGEIWISDAQNAFGMVLEESGLGKFMMSNGGASSNLMNFYTNGKISIGNTTPAVGSSHRLFVEGGLTSEEVVINCLDKNGYWPDYVFKSGYDLMPVSELAGYVEKNGRLPGMPSADDVIKDGINVYEMNRLLLEKIEELTLYIIKQQEEIDNIKKNLK